MTTEISKDICMDGLGQAHRTQAESFWEHLFGCLHLHVKSARLVGYEITSRDRHEKMSILLSKAQIIG